MNHDVQPTDVGRISRRDFPPGDPAAEELQLPALKKRQYVLYSGLQAGVLQRQASHWFSPTFAKAN